MNHPLLHTARTSAGRRCRRRTLWLGIAALGLVASIGIGVPVALHDRGADDAPSVVSLVPTEHQVRYEVEGSGLVPSITYAVGERNRSERMTDVPLPWSRSVPLPIGPGGGFAQIEVKSPQNGGGPITCRVHVDGELKQEQTSADGYSGSACSALIAPQYVR